jgi:hypothetical protein
VSASYLQLINHRQYWCNYGRATRRGRRNGLLKANTNTNKSNSAAGNTLTYHKEWPDTYLPVTFTQWSPITVVIRWGAAHG